MKLPLIVIVDDDEQVLKALRRDLRAQYRGRYEVLDTSSATEALLSLQALSRQGDEVALFLSDQRMPEMLGVTFLAKARKIFPRARRVLLTAYSDTQAAIQAINEVQLDYYLLKPWDPPEEKLYPTLDEQLDEWQAGYSPAYSGIRVYGYPYTPKAHKIKDFLSGNLFPYRWFDLQADAEAREWIGQSGLENAALPVVVTEEGKVLEDPELDQLAEALGRTAGTMGALYDVAIVGAGPAGLGAAVYGGSEGLKTAVIEKRAPGGQAGTSSRIENYLGFPKGLSGSELSRRALAQATRFGVSFVLPREVFTLQQLGDYKRLTFTNGEELLAKSVVLSAGVDYRMLEAPGLEAFTGAGVYYGAASTEAQSCKNEDVYVVGGGNSAGQAAVYLSNFARKVFIVIRKPDLSSSMSAYLIDQIAAIPNIELVPESEVVGGRGEGRLQFITLLHRPTGNQNEVALGALFIFIGAKPFTEWLPEELLRDARGFVLTGRDLQQDPRFPKIWKEARAPEPLESSMPGVFAAGDVRSGAMNRVASAVGEGAMSISMVHKYLAQF